VNGGGATIVQAGVSALMVYTAGPYTAGDMVDIIVEDAADATCNATLATGVVSCCGGLCSSAAMAVVGLNTATPLTCGAGASAIPCDGGAAATNARWYVFTAPALGTLTVSSENDPLGTDTRLGIHTGTCGALVCEAGNDDIGGGVFGSAVTLPVTAATDYYIEWDDRWSTDGFDWELTFSPCAPAIATATTIDNCGAGTFTVDVDLTDLGSATTVNILEDVNGAGPTVVQAGVSALMIYALGPYTNGDLVDITIEDAADATCNLTVVTGISSCCGGVCATAATATIGINTTPTIDCGGGASNAFATGATNAQWFEFTPPADGQIDVTACATATTDTRLTIHSGTCGALTLEVGADDVCGLTSEVLALPVIGGTTYYIEWDDRWDATTFDWELNYLTCMPPAATASTGNIDCVAGTYNVFVVLGDLGSAATVDISSDVLGVEQTGVSTLTSYTVGPYPLGTPATISIIHDTDGACDITVGTFNESAANCPVTTFPFCQSFDTEALCVPLCQTACPTTNGYVQDITDDTDWTTHTGVTTSTATGPPGAFVGPNYMYVEASGACNPNVTAVMFTNEFDISSLVNEPQIGFYYHMLGADQGTLTVDVESPSMSGNFTNLFTISGDQGAAWNDAGFLSAFVTGPVIRFRFTGETGTGFDSDIAIDEICVRERPNCTSPMASATLEHSPLTLTLLL